MIDKVKYLRQVVDTAPCKEGIPDKCKHCIAKFALSEAWFIIEDACNAGHCLFIPGAVEEAEELITRAYVQVASKEPQDKGRNNEKRSISC